MYLISTEGYKNADVHILIIKLLVKFGQASKILEVVMGVNNISDLILKEIYSVLKTKNPTKKQINKYKMTEREIYEKFDNLSEEELNIKSNKKIYTKKLL